MTDQELEVLIAQTLEMIYRNALNNNLTNEEYDCFISSVLYSISLGLNKSAYKKLRASKENTVARSSENGDSPDLGSDFSTGSLMLH